MSEISKLRDNIFTVSINSPEKIMMLLNSMSEEGDPKLFLFSLYKIFELYKKNGKNIEIDLEELKKFLFSKYNSVFAFFEANMYLEAIAMCFFFKLFKTFSLQKANFIIFSISKYAF